MKNRLLSLSAAILAFCSAEVSSQTIVSTSPENKKVVLEEFTGIYCTYCPDGHKLAQQLKDANPGNVVLVNIHTGSYANPTGGDPDFKTNWGSAIAGQSNLAGYPAGTVNRHEFGVYNQQNQEWSFSQNGGTAMNRGDWGTTAAQEFAIASPVNVAATATWDVSANEIVVYVEAYYTANSNASTNKLNVAILENNVKGPQTGGTSFNPTNFDSEGNYLHQHMLRDFITGQWGEDISTTTTGTFYSNTFTYPIPADYNGIEANPTEFEVAVYITEGQQEVLTGVEVPVSITNIANADDSKLTSVEDLGAYCGYFATPEVTIRNMGSDTLKSLNITYNINGSNSSNYQWNGSLVFYQSETITLPIIPFITAGTNTINVSTANPNGNTDGNPIDDSGSSSFTDAPEATSTTVEFELKTDDYGSETSWELTDELGTVLYSEPVGTYPDQSVIYNETWNLPDNGCYTFTINDAYGDGICCGSGAGYYRLSSNSAIFITGGGFGSGEERAFNETAGSTTPLSSTNSSTGSTSTTNCDGTATVIPSGGMGPYTFLWDDGNSQTTITATGLCAGVYYCTVLDNDGNIIMPSVTVDDISVPPLSIMNGFQLANLEVSPNPFGKSTIVAFSITQTQNVAISILNLMGEKVVSFRGKTYERGNYQEKIDASSLPAGIYFLDVNIEGFSNIKKVTHIK